MSDDQNTIWLEGKYEELGELNELYQSGEITSFEYAKRKIRINEEMAYYGFDHIDEHHDQEINYLNSR